LGSSPTPPWVFSSIHGGFPSFGVGEEDRCKLEMETRMRDTNRAWSMEHGA